MPTDTIRGQIHAMFRGLHRKSAAGAIPPPGSLSARLSRLVESAVGETSRIDAETLAHFATASVEMWHRSIHSFLISASLTKASPLWASVSGYYSSHYAIRAFAHLLGYFHLHTKKRIVHVEVSGSHYICYIITKKAGEREHRLYWKVVKKHSRFIGDPFFTINDESQPRSDSGHRCKANYADHINSFPAFQILDEVYLKERVEKIASVELSDAPIPMTGSYPDIENVQLVAYHRMVKFRRLVDEVLGGANRFWSVQRCPGWSQRYLDYQIIEAKYTSVYRDHLS